MSVFSSLSNIVSAPFEAFSNVLSSVLNLGNTAEAVGGDRAAQSSFFPGKGAYWMNQENMDFNERMMYANAQLNAEENARQRAFQSDMWNHQFNRSTDYRLIADRLRKAGINPSAMLSSVGSVPSIGNVGSAPSVSSPASASGGMVGTSAFTTMAQLMDAKNNIRATDLQETKQKATLSAEIDKILADARASNALADYQETNNEIVKAYGKSEKAAEILRINAEAYKAYCDGDYQKAAKLNQKAMEKLNNQTYQQNEKQFPIVITNMKKMGEVYDSEVQKNKATASAAYAQGNYLNALSVTENALRDGKVTAQELSNNIAAVQLMIAERQNNNELETNKYRVQAMIADFKRSELINEQTEQAIQRMIIDNDWAGVEHAVGVVSSVVGSVTDIATLPFSMWSQAKKIGIQETVANKVGQATEKVTTTRKNPYTGNKEVIERTTPMTKVNVPKYY